MNTSLILLKHWCDYSDAIEAMAADRAYSPVDGAVRHVPADTDGGWPAPLCKAAFHIGGAAIVLTVPSAVVHTMLLLNG